MLLVGSGCSPRELSGPEDIGSSEGPVSEGGGEGMGGAGRWGIAGPVLVLWAPVATGGGISASFTARPFFAAVSIVCRVCEGKWKEKSPREKPYLQSRIASF